MEEGFPDNGRTSWREVRIRWGKIKRGGVRLNRPAGKAERLIAGNRERGLDHYCCDRVEQPYERPLAGVCE